MDRQSLKYSRNLLSTFLSNIDQKLKVPRIFWKHYVKSIVPWWSIWEKNHTFRINIFKNTIWIQIMFWTLRFFVKIWPKKIEIEFLLNMIVKTVWNFAKLVNMVEVFWKLWFFWSNFVQKGAKIELPLYFSIDLSKKWEPFSEWSG